jgi:hypothetical protein
MKDSLNSEKISTDSYALDEKRRKFPLHKITAAGGLMLVLLVGADLAKEDITEHHPEAHATALQNIPDYYAGDDSIINASYIEVTEPVDTPTPPPPPPTATPFPTPTPPEIIIPTPVPTPTSTPRTTEYNPTPPTPQECLEELGYAAGATAGNYLRPRKKHGRINRKYIHWNIATTEEDDPAKSQECKKYGNMVVRVYAASFKRNDRLLRHPSIRTNSMVKLTDPKPGQDIPRNRHLARPLTTKHGKLVVGEVTYNTWASNTGASKTVVTKDAIPNQLDFK